MIRPRKYKESSAVILPYRKDGVNYTFEHLRETARKENTLNTLKKLKGPSKYIVQYETKPTSGVKGLGLIKTISEEGILYSQVWMRQPPLKSNIIKKEKLHYGYPLYDHEFKQLLKDFFEKL
ncbi:MAG: hypothetical protein O8C64_09735 [Candidatus Methanoperedens sp.]|nr:hypothetical protein [Candidatus Methanoperedens sp.]MCZ7403388.1 hypothetical protein [Candidatus Methanoperedens sp.]